VDGEIETKFAILSRYNGSKIEEPKKGGY